MHPWPHCSSSSRSMGKTEECKPLANSKLNYGVIAKFPEDRCIKQFDNLIQTCAARVRYAVKQATPRRHCWGSRPVGANIDLEDLVSLETSGTEAASLGTPCSMTSTFLSRLIVYVRSLGWSPGRLRTSSGHAGSTISFLRWTSRF